MRVLFLSLILCLPAASRAQGAAFTIQIAASPSEAEARAVAAEARARGVEVLIVRQGNLYRIRVGSFASRQQAERAAREFVQRGRIAAFFVTRMESGESALSPVDADRSWSLVNYAPMAAALREIAEKPAGPAGVADRVLRLAARSTDAAARAVRERSNRQMIPIRNRERGYAYNRPRDWRESETSAESLRQEGIAAGEMFVSPDAAAFLSSAFRSFQADFDGMTPVRALTPEVLIEKLLGKLRRLPGVNGARAIAHRTMRKEGVERIELELELSFRPTANDSSEVFAGQAVVLRNDSGVLELIGMRRGRNSTGAAQRLLDQSLSSATLQ
jgi:hypothetical protein